MVVGNRVELLELNAFDGIELIFQLLQRQHARLALVQRFGQQLGRLNRGGQPLNGEWLDVDFTIAARHLLQTYADHHALVTRVHHVKYRVADARFQLTVQTFIA